jgi:hypothetical protein
MSEIFGEDTEDSTILDPQVIVPDAVHDAAQFLPG